MELNRRRLADDDSYVFCRRFLRCIVIFTCFIALLGGVGCLAIGLWIAIEKALLEQVVGSLFISSAYILIAVGVVTVIVAFLGCFGAAKRSRCALLTYFVFLLMLFLLVLIAGILGFLFAKEISAPEDSESVIKALKENYGENTKLGRLISTSWDYIQSNYGCCGYTNEEGRDFNFWKSSKWFNKQDAFPVAHVPPSCCTICERLLNKISCSNKSRKDANNDDRDKDVRDEMRMQACGRCPIASQNYVNLTLCQGKTSNLWPTDVTDFIYLEPCKQKLEDDMTDVGTVLGALGIGLACLLLTSMVIALCLCMLI